MTNRINYIDRMKGFTILLVVIGHIYLFGVHISDSIPYKFIAACHMHLFMFLSGFVAYISSNDVKSGAKSTERTIVRRIFSYIVPCFTVIWIAGLYSYFVSDKPNNLILHQCLYGGYWYLKSLTLYSILLYFITKADRIWATAVILIVSYTLFYLGWRTSPLLNEILSLEHAVCFSPFFFMGYFFRKYNLLYKTTRNNWLFTVALVGFTILFFTELPVHALQVISERFVRPTLAILLISYLFGQRASKNSAIETWLERLGTKTLDIYLYHGFFLMDVGFGVININRLGSWILSTDNHMFGLIAIIAVSILLSYISIWIGQLLKCSKLFRIILYGQFFPKKEPSASSILADMSHSGDRNALN